MNRNHGHYYVICSVENVFVLQHAEACKKPVTQKTCEGLISRPFEVWMYFLFSLFHAYILPSTFVSPIPKSRILQGLNTLQLKTN